MSRRHLAAFALTALALTGAGCGKSGASSPSSPSSPSSASSASSSDGEELVARADAICNRVVTQRNALPKIKTRHDYATVLARAGALQQNAIAELEKLKAPSSLAKDWQQILSVDRTLIGYTAAYGRDVSSDNPRAARALLKSAISLQASIAGIAKRDGLVACGEITT